MKKSNIGISTNLFAALIYFTAFFSGWLGLLLVAGYTLLKEEDEWLKKTAVKALVLTAAFTVVPSIIGLIPDSIGVLNSFLDIFGGNVSAGVLYSIFDTIDTVIYFVEKVVFILLGINALSHKTIKIPYVDDVSKKHFN